MIKKVTAALLIFMIFSGYAFAETLQNIITDVQVTVSNAGENKILVTGKAPADKYVTITVLNPGFEESNLVVNNYTAMTSAVAYSNAVKAVGGVFSFEFPVKAHTPEQIAAGGGLFNIILTCEDTKKTVEDYEFYYQSKKTDVIQAINNSTNFALDLAEAIRVYSLGTNAFWVNGDKAEVEKACIYIKNTKTNKKFDEIGENAVNDFADALEDSLLMGAINASKKELLSSNGILNDAVLALADSADKTVYLDEINEVGQKAFTDKLLSKKYENKDAVTAEIKELAAFYAIYNNVKGGYGHVQGYLTKYNDIYVKYGFNLADESKITNSAISVFMATPAQNFTQMAENFNNAINPPIIDTDPDPTPGGGGGGGSTIKPQTPPSEGLVDPETTDQPPIVPSPFGDMGNTAWADEAVSVLYKEGIISGYSQNEFRPDMPVTRAEYTKLIMVLAEIKEIFEKENADLEETGFNDVNTDDWYSNYVAQASMYGIVNGDGNSFMPNNTITRQDACVMFYRLLSEVMFFESKAEFSDMGDVSSYAKSAVSYLAGAEIINGMGDGSFSPKSTLTRAQAAVIVYEGYKILGELEEAK